MNVQLTFSEWWQLTHLILWPSFDFQAFESQHLDRGNSAAVAVGVMGSETGLESHQEGKRTEEEGHWPSYGPGQFDCRSQRHRDAAEGK